MDQFNHPERATYDAPVFAKLLGVGRNAVYDAIKRGDIKSVTIGAKRVVIPKSELDRLLAGKEAQV